MKIKSFKWLWVLSAGVWLILMAGAWNGADASESESYNFSWLDPDKKIYVLQNRKYTKAGRVMVTALGGIGWSNPYRNVFSLEPRLAFYLSESFGVEAFYSKLSNSPNTTIRALEAATQASLLPMFREIRGQMGALVHWVPWYAKINVFNQILYFDWGFQFGAGRLEAYKLTKTLNNQVNYDQVSDSQTAFFAGTTQHFFISQNWSMRLDLLGAFYNATYKKDSGGQNVVFKLSVWRRNWLSSLISCSLFLLTAGSALASDEGALKRIAEAQQLYASKQYFKAARYAFAAIQENPSRQPEAHAWVALSLIDAGLEQSASYFFIQALASQEKAIIRRVLTKAERMLWAVGPDLINPYLLKYTSSEDYDSKNRIAYLYVAARDALMAGDEKKALSFLEGVSPSGRAAGEIYQLRASIHSSAGKLDLAYQDFQRCERAAKEVVDLKNRCLAGQARVLYEKQKFEEADVVYDQIAKQSMVWPEILFEQAWNAYRRNEFNRTLGKLVSYKSPALSFVYNPEVEVLRAQSYLSLCLYPDAEKVVDEFNATYSVVGEQVKQLLEKNNKKLSGLFDAAKVTAAQPLTSSKPLNRLMNRFVRSPTFQRWIQSERDLYVELQSIREFSKGQPAVAIEKGKGFPDFLNEVLNFRLKAIRALAGAFVKNSLLDYHSELISNYEKMSFIKLEMLRRFKEKLMTKRSVDYQQGLGNVVPSRRDDQLYWAFNGEFWNDELGDYVFGLESDCHE